MNWNWIKTICISVLLAGSMTHLVSCSNNVEGAKEEQKAAETAAGKAGLAPAGGDIALAAADTESTESKPKNREEIIKKVKEIYICPRINMSLADAENSGAMCDEGQKILGIVEKMIDSPMTAEEIYHMVSNYRIQGRELVQSNGQELCEKDGMLKLDAFIMSYCPYGVRFVDTTLNPMIGEFNDRLDWMPYYIMNESAEEGKLQAMHGQKEVDENLRQICIRDEWGLDKWLSYMDCFSSEIYGKRNNNPKNWDYCAEQADIDPDKLETCAEEDGFDLAQKDMELTRKYRATGSPTAVYNCGKNIVGAIPFSSIKSRVCRLFPGEQPEACVN